MGFSKSNLINKLENVQLDVARIVTGGTKLTGLNRLYEETKCEKLSDRRQNHKLILFHKIKNNKTPQYLLDLIPNSVCSRQLLIIFYTVLDFLTLGRN